MLRVLAALACWLVVAAARAALNKLRGQKPRHDDSDEYGEGGMP
jgi:hypothetical protein